MEIGKKKKGVVFSLDAAIAVTVIIIILINSAYYFSTSSKESLSQLQPLRIGSDVLAILDYTGNLDEIIATDSIGSQFIDITKLNMSYYLPANYEMKLSINELQESIANLSIKEDPLGVCTRGNGNQCILDADDGSCTSPDFVNLSTLPIQTAGFYALMVKTDQPDLVMTPVLEETLTMTVDGDVNPITLPYFDLNGGYFGYYHNFTTGINTVTFTNCNADENIEIEWFRVIGSDAYALETDITLPTNRFIGSGERIIAAVQGETFYGFHNVRYWIWLKSSI